MLAGARVRGSAVVLVAALAAIASGASVPGAVATTAPGQVYTVTVYLTDQGMELPIESNRYGRTIVYKRGAVLNYHVVNQGTKPYAFLVGKKRTPALAPGHQTTIQVQWTTRGSYRWERLFKGKPIGQTGIVRVT